MEARYSTTRYYCYLKLRMANSFVMLMLATTVFSQTPEQSRQIREALHSLNQIRREAGLDTVWLDAGLNRGCYNHARYLVINKGRPEIEGLRAHEELQKLKGYTPEGANAGGRSVICFIPPERAITGWMNTFYHRIPLLMPDLKRIGFGFYQQGDNVACVLDCLPGWPSGKRIIVYCPGPDETVMPWVYDMEIPDPIPQCKWFDGHGFPVTITFTQNMKITEVTFKLTDNHNEPVDCWFSTPENPAPGNRQGNSICAIPKTYLKTGTIYTVTLHCKINGAAFDKQYNFKTMGSIMLRCMPNQNRINVGPAFNYVCGRCLAYL